MDGMSFHHPLEGLVIIISTDQAYHCGVICKLDYGGRAINGCAVMDEQRVEERAKCIVPWNTSVQYKIGGHVVVKPTRLWSVNKEVQGLITEGSAYVKVGELGDQLGRVVGVKSQAEINE